MENEQSYEEELESIREQLRKDKQMIIIQIKMLRSFNCPPQFIVVLEKVLLSLFSHPFNQQNPHKRFLQATKSANNLYQDVLGIDPREFPEAAIIKARKYMQSSDRYNIQYGKKVWQPAEIFIKWTFLAVRQKK